MTTTKDAIFTSEFGELRDDASKARPAYRARAYERPTVRWQYRDRDGVIQQSTLTATGLVRSGGASEEQRSALIRGVRTILGAFDCELTHMEFVDTHNWEIGK